MPIGNIDQCWFISKNRICKPFANTPQDPTTISSCYCSLHVAGAFLQSTHPHYSRGLIQDKLQVLWIFSFNVHSCNSAYLVSHVVNHCFHLSQWIMIRCQKRDSHCRQRCCCFSSSWRLGSSDSWKTNVFSQSKTMCVFFLKKDILLTTSNDKYFQKWHVPQLLWTTSLDGYPLTYSGKSNAYAKKLIQ